MVDEDKIKILDECKDLAGKIDHKALAGAVGVMLLSWLGLPVVYWLIVHRNDEKVDSEAKVRNESKETEKK